MSEEILERESEMKDNWPWTPEKGNSEDAVEFGEEAKLTQETSDYTTGDSEATNCNENWRKAKSIYDFSVIDIFHNEVPLAKYKDMVLVIVNVASQCGLTEVNYQEMVQLAEALKDQPFKILAFPSNQFAAQEPGTNQEIHEFAKSKNADELIDFFEKVNVNGETSHPLWKYLKHEKPGTLGNFIKWNFTKFIIDRNGKPVERHGPSTNPSEIIENIQSYF